MSGAGKIIIGVTGPMASGKGTIAEYLKEHHGAVVFRFSNILRDLLDRLHKPHTREFLQDISTILRKLFGEDVLAEVMASDVMHSDAEVIVVEGIRRRADIAHVEKIPGFVLVGVDADDEVRYRRYVSRAENPGDREMTIEQWRERSNAETETLIPELLRQARIVWDNNGTKEDLYSHIEALIHEHAQR